MKREMINLPKRQYLHATTTTITPTSTTTALAITSANNIARTITSVARTTKAEDIEINI